MTIQYPQDSTAEGESGTKWSRLIESLLSPLLPFCCNTAIDDDNVIVQERTIDKQPLGSDTVISSTTVPQEVKLREGEATTVSECVAADSRSDQALSSISQREEAGAESSEGTPTSQQAMSYEELCKEWIIQRELETKNLILAHIQKEITEETGNYVLLRVGSQDEANDLIRHLAHQLYGETLIHEKPGRTKTFEVKALVRDYALVRKLIRIDFLEEPENKEICHIALTPLFPKRGADFTYGRSSSIILLNIVPALSEVLLEKLLSPLGGRKVERLNNGEVRVECDTVAIADGLAELLINCNICGSMVTARKSLRDITSMAATLANSVPDLMELIRSEQREKDLLSELAAEKELRVEAEMKAAHLEEQLRELRMNRPRVASSAPHSAPNPDSPFIAHSSMSSATGSLVSEAGPSSKDNIFDPEKPSEKYGKGVKRINRDRAFTIALISS